MNRTTVIRPVLVLAGVLARGKVAEPGAESEMKDMRLIAGGTFRMGDVFDEGVRFGTPVHEVRMAMALRRAGWNALMFHSRGSRGARGASP